MDSKQPVEPRVMKIEVARRQIIAAVRMFFSEADPVATHSVISAGHQILTDLGASRDIHSLIRTKGDRERLALVNVAANFFKHADRDPNEGLFLSKLPELNAEFLMDATLLLQRLTDDLPFEGKVYWSWFVSKHPELFENVTTIPRFEEFDLDVDDFKSIATLLRMQEVLEGLET